MQNHDDEFACKFKYTLHSFSIKLFYFFNFTLFQIMNVKLMLLSAVYPGSLTMNQPFTPELSNPHTPEFQEAEDNFCSQVACPLATLKEERGTLRTHCF